MTHTFIVNGQAVSAEDLIDRAPKQKARPKKEAPAQFHKGFRVVGHAPGAMEAARDANRADWAAWNSHGADARERALKKGLRPPPMWDEEKWRARTKKTAVRSKPYELSAAADQCAAMATASGWLDVTVEVLSQGDAPPDGMF